MLGFAGPSRPKRRRWPPPPPASSPSSPSPTGLRVCLPVRRFARRHRVVTVIVTVGGGDRLSLKKQGDDWPIDTYGRGCGRSPQPTLNRVSAERSCRGRCGVV